MTDAVLDIHLQQSFTRSAAEILDCLKTGQFLGLTGADVVQQEFRPGGAFTLGFSDRGSVWGTFLRIESSLVVLSWNVAGFWPIPEVDTEVSVHLTDQAGGCLVTVDHARVSNADSAAGKRRAWARLLQDLHHQLEARPVEG